MCGRFTLKTTPETLTETFPGFTMPDEMTPRYNIAPSQGVAVVPNSGENRVEFFQWGLIPSWAKDPKIGNRMINARAETLAEKPSFRTPYKRRRCLILSDGFYEWRSEPGSKSKTPIYVQLKSEQPFASRDYGRRGIPLQMMILCSPAQSSRPRLTRSWRPSIDGCRSSLNPMTMICGWTRVTKPPISWMGSSSLTPLRRWWLIRFHALSIDLVTTLLIALRLRRGRYEGEDEKTRKRAANLV